MNIPWYPTSGPGMASSSKATASSTPAHDGDGTMSPFFPHARIPTSYEAAGSNDASSSSDASSLPTPETAKDACTLLLNVAAGNAHHQRQQMASHRGGVSHRDLHAGGCDDANLVDVLFPRQHGRNGGGTDQHHGDICGVSGVGISSTECDKCDFSILDDSSITPAWCSEPHCSAATTTCCEADHTVTGNNTAASTAAVWGAASSADPFVCDFAPHNHLQHFDDCCDPHHHSIPATSCPDAHCSTSAVAATNLCPIDGEPICTDPACDEAGVASADACKACEHPAVEGKADPPTMDETMQAFWNCCTGCPDGSGNLDFEACCRALDEAGHAAHCHDSHATTATTTTATATGGTTTPNIFDDCQFMVPHQHDQAGLCIDPCLTHQHAQPHGHHQHHHPHGQQHQPYSASLMHTCKWADCSFRCASQHDLYQHVNDVHLQAPNSTATTSSVWPSYGAPSTSATPAAPVCQWDSCNTQQSALFTGMGNDADPQAALLEHLIQSHLGPLSTPGPHQHQGAAPNWPTHPMSSFSHAPAYPHSHHQLQHQHQHQHQPQSQLQPSWRHAPPHVKGPGILAHGPFSSSANQATASTSSLAASPSTSSSSSAMGAVSPRTPTTSPLDRAVAAPKPTPRATGTASSSVAATPSSSQTAADDQPVPDGKHPCGWINCSLSFGSHEALTNHIASVHIGGGKSSYTCGWIGCDRAAEGKEFAQRQKILRHVQTHTGHRPFKCETCGKRFSEANTLSQHVRTHTREKPYACDYPGCTARFAVAGSLTIHKRSRHTNERPFVCEWPGCGKRFAESSNLTKHRRTHNGEKPFVCQECKRAFSRPDQLQRHRKVHEGSGLHTGAHVVDGVGYGGGGGGAGGGEASVKRQKIDAEPVGMRTGMAGSGA